MAKNQNESPDLEEEKEKVGFFWGIAKKSMFGLSKGLFRLIIPKKLDKQHLTLSLVVILGIVLLFIFFVEPLLNLLGTILLIIAIVAILGGIFMFLTGKNPVKKE